MVVHCLSLGVHFTLSFLTGRLILSSWPEEIVPAAGGGQRLLPLGT